LRHIQLFIEKDGVVGAGVCAQLTTDTFFRIDDDQSVCTLVDCLCLALLNTGGVVTMVAEVRGIGNLDMGDMAANHFSQPDPELTGVRLWF
jgi:hypothetical protein